MNDQPKRPGREEIFEVFRPLGDHDVSAESYRVTKPSQARERHGPLEKNQWIDKGASLPSQAIEPRELTLSGAEAADPANAPVAAANSTADAAQHPTPIRLETFRIDMQERLAAMQAAQQKAKDQLNELKKQNPPEDEPPAD